MKFTTRECEKIAVEYYFQSQTGNISEIKCPVEVCKDGVVIFGIQVDGMIFPDLDEETMFPGVKILHFYCASCEREGRFP